MRLFAIVSPVLLLMAAGCAATGDQGFALAFHNDAAIAAAPKSLSFVAADPEKAQSPVFVSVADAAGEHLRKFGYMPAPSADRADVVGKLDWTMSRWSGDDSGDGSGGRIAIGVGGGSGHFGFGTGISLPLSGGGSKIRYHYRLRLELAPAAGGTNLYEATVEVDSKTANPDAVLPRMLDALFLDFPGGSGQTRKITLPSEK